MSEDKELKQWKEKLFYQPKNGYDRIDAEQTGEIFAYAEGYKQFLNAAARRSCWPCSGSSRLTTDA